jgi:hypothetical protein
MLTKGDTMSRTTLFCSESEKRPGDLQVVIEDREERSEGKVKKKNQASRGKSVLKKNRFVSGDQGE